MNILSIPFHHFLNFKRYDGDEYIFEAEERPEYLNHLGTIHACLQTTLAEASSGEFLLNEFNELKDDLIPVVRRTELKYQKPANGSLYAKASFVDADKETVVNELMTKGRSIIKVRVEVFDAQKNRTLTAVFDWFVTKK